MKIKVVRKVSVEKEIDRCYHQCLYFGLEGGPGAVMICNHPKAPKKGFIISHPDCDNGFPKDCPLLKKLNNRRTE